MKRLLYCFVVFFLALSLFLAPFAKAQSTYTAASCSQAAISAAIARERANPVDGDIISIPAGTACTWTGVTGIIQTFNNSVTIQGAGAKSATTGGAGTTGSDQTIIIDNYAYGSAGAQGAMITFNTVAGKSFRITGISFQQNSSTLPVPAGTLTIGGSSSSVRIDHNHFVTGVSQGMLFIGGSILGVADHNVFNAATLSSLTNHIRFHNGVGWNGSNESGNAIGDHSWADTEHWGTSSFFFAEDNQFNDGDIGDGHDGTRYVLRHNTMQVTPQANCPPLGGTNPPSTCSGIQMYDHGVATGRSRSTKEAEVYQNTWTMPVVSGGAGAGNPAYSVNGGTLLFWGNTVTQFKGAVTIGYTCRRDPTGCNYGYPNPPNGWGHCGAAYGPSGWDLNSDSTGYACIDQPGRGAGDLLSGDFAPPNGAGPGACNLALNPACNILTGQWPRQAISPIYVWANNYTPSAGYGGPTLVSVSGNGVPDIVKDNREFYQQFGTNAEPGSFNGTTGVGQGLLSARPSTCTAGPGGNTPGVGYWATDANTLYVCNPTNTWTAYYTPYTYPHPLTQSSLGTSLAPPTNLNVTVN